MKDPREASAIAVSRRRARAEVKRQLMSGERAPIDVARVAWTGSESAERGLRVPEFLGSIRGLGVTKVSRILDDLDISPRKRLGMLGAHQRKRLEDWLSARPVSARHGGRQGRLVVVAGPTAVGKGTVVGRIRELLPETRFSVSATTRAPRPGEIEGFHYFFVSPDEFDRLVAADQMLEWATVHGEHRYGTPRQPIVDALGAGHSVILEIDIQGARQVKQSMPDAVLVFLEPPSWDELVRRLTTRGTETAEEQARRLATAEAELASKSEFDITVLNDDVDRAAKAVIELLS